MAGLYYIKFLRTGEINNKDLDEINNLLKQIDSLLSHTDVNVYLIKVEILQCKLQQAYERIKSLLSRIKNKDFNSEYYVPYNTLMCELINKELHQRKNNKEVQIQVPEKKLRSNSFFRTFLTSYPHGILT